MSPTPLTAWMARASAVILVCCIVVAAAGDTRGATATGRPPAEDGSCTDLPLNTCQEKWSTGNDDVGGAKGGLEEAQKVYDEAVSKVGELSNAEESKGGYEAAKEKASEAAAQLGAQMRRQAAAAAVAG